MDKYRETEKDRNRDRKINISVQRKKKRWRKFEKKNLKNTDRERGIEGKFEGEREKSNPFPVASLAKQTHKGKK